MIHPFGNTAFETSPVESLFDAIKSFSIAFDIFHSEICNDIEHKEVLENIKTALYKPVYPDKDTSAPISLFEVGFMYMPSGKNLGTYTVNEQKLTDALQKRESDIKSLFTHSDGLLGEVIELMTNFLDKDLPEEVYVSGKNFLNECYRLEAMF